jgi:hypothetical protein
MSDRCVWGVLTLVGLFLVNLALMLYLAYFRMKEVMGYLSNSPAVMYRSLRPDWGLLSRLSLLGYVSMMLTIPHHAINKGLLDAEDYEQFPRHLKLIVKFSNCFMWSLSALLAVMYVLYR